MARFLVSFAYGGKKYAELIKASDAQNAIEFCANKCIEVAAKATGLTFKKIVLDINEDFDAYEEIPFEAQIVH